MAQVQEKHIPTATTKTAPPSVYKFSREVETDM